MVNAQAVVTSLYVLGAWTTVSTVMILLARRDVALGLKKWWFLRRRKQPIKLRYHGPDKTVTEYIIPTKGKGETLEINGKRLLVIKTHNGSTFFLNEDAIRRGDDGVNEISYLYKSTMPLNPDLTPEEVAQERLDVVRRIAAAKKDVKEGDGFIGVQLEELAQYTDPKRLNRLIEYIKLVAKTEAMLRATELQKWVKWTLFGVGAVLLLSVLIWYTLDGKMLPLLTSVAQAAQGASAGVINVG